VPRKGRVRYLLEEPQEAGPGEVVLIPVDLRHGARIREDFTVLNCKNSVAGGSVYNAGWEK
jgi:quercetin dioxygenase-like cupin family protein